MKKVLIFGAYGMAGHVVADTLRKIGKWEVIRCVRKANDNDKNAVSVDVTNFEKVYDVLREQQPDIVVNCIGMLVKACADDPAAAILINSYFPNFLAKSGKSLNFKLIHISTDCVFSGHKGSSYRDNDFRDGDTPYARTKALGEIVDDRNLTIRTSIIGPELKNGTGLFHWFMQQHGTIYGYTRAFWSGVTTIELAKVIVDAIDQNLIGLYQLTMPEKIAKYDLLCLFKEIWNRNDIVIEPNSDYYCDKSMIASTIPFKHAMPPSYRAMLLEMKQWMQEHPESK